MPGFTDRLKQLRIEKHITQKELAGFLNVTQNAIFNWENGKREPSIEMIEKIANYFNVSPSYLMGWDDGVQQYFRKPSKEEKEIEKLLDSTLEQLLSQDGLMFDGDPATPEAIDSILSAMRIGMEMAKKKNKEKYTPKKYKKD